MHPTTLEANSETSACPLPNEGDAYYREMFELAPLPYQSLDIAGNFIDINQAWLDYFGCARREDVIGRFFGDFMRESSRPLMGITFANFKREGFVSSPVFEAEHQRSGETILFTVNGRIRRDAQGEFVRTHCILSDATARAKAEAELNAYRSHLELLVEERTAALSVAKTFAEAANIAKSAFLANMSHEMRTPLHQIIGMVQLVKHEALSTKQTDRLNKIALAGHRLNEMIDGLFTLTELEAQKLTLKSEPLAIQTLLDGIRAQLQETASRKGLQLIFATDTALPPLMGDREYLRMALLCYANNAITFTEKGSVIIRVNLLNETAESALVSFAVADTGIGIAADVLPRLFNIFEQVDNSSTRKYGGAGIGLATVKRLVQLMGGEVGCESIEGQGSTFWFTALLKKA